MLYCYRREQEVEGEGGFPAGLGKQSVRLSIAVDRGGQRCHVTVSVSAAAVAKGAGKVQEQSKIQTLYFNFSPQSGMD